MLLMLFGALTSQGQNNTLTIPDVTVAAGQTISLPVNLDNTADIVGVQFTLSVEEGIILEPSSAVLSERADDHKVIMQKIDADKYMAMVFSKTNKAIKGRTGTLMTIKLTASSSVEEGAEYPMSLSEVIIGAVNGDNLATGMSCGKVTIAKSPDLEVSNVTTSTTTVNPGDKINVSWQVSNIGGLPTQGGWKEQIYLDGTEGTSKLLSTTYYENPLGVGGLAIRSAEIELPQILGLDGESTIRVKLTPNNDAGEPSWLCDNNVSSTNSQITVNKYLSVTPEVVSVEEAKRPTLRFYLSRSGNTLKDETITLVSTQDSRLTISPSVTIPKGKSAIYFYGEITPNGELDDIDMVELNLSGNGYEAVVAKINIEDDTLPSLYLTTSVDEIVEGGTLTMTVEAERAPKEDLEIELSNNFSARFEIPSVILPAGQTKVQVSVEAKQDDVPDIEQTVTFTASAAGYNPGSEYIMLVDDDIPTLELTLTPDAVSEVAGPLAIVAKLRRTDNINKAVTVKFSDDSDGGIYYVRKSVEMPSGVEEVMVNLGPIDNAIVDGERTYNISAAVWIASCSCSANGSQGGEVTATLTIYDNDGPSLGLTSPLTMVKEGGEIELTVSRNTETSQSITVNVSSDQDSWLEYPSTVVIPAGEQSITFIVKAIDNDENSGDLSVNMTVASADFAKSSIWFTITDQTLPDAQILSVDVSDSEVLAGECVSVSAQIANGGSFVLPQETKLSFFIDNTKKAVATTMLPKALGVGESVTVDYDIQIPSTIGQYKVYAKVNDDKAFKELTYDNNMSQFVTVRILSPYKASVQLGKNTYQPGETIVVTGNIQGKDVSEKEVEVYFINGNDRRTAKAKTLEDGSFSVEYTPIVGQMGHFIVGACYASENLSEEMASFDINGIKTSAWSKCELAVSETYKGTITISNPGSVPQTGIKVTPLVESDNCEFTFSSIDKIEAGKSATIEYTIKGNNATTTLGKWQEMPIKITSEEGSEADHKFYYYVQSLHGQLYVPVSTINTTMTLGSERDYPITIRNIGKGETGQFSLSLPPCVSSVTPQRMPSLASGDSVTVILRFVPTDEMKLNVATRGTIGFNCDNGNGTQIKFAVTPVSEAKGTLKLDLVDEFTFFTEEAPHISGAKVTIKKPSTNEIIVDGLTDHNGIFMAELQEGWYTVNIEADKHDDYTFQIVVDPGVVKEQEIFMPYQVVTYSWDVVETEIEDEYVLETVAKFETRVPKPIIVMTLPDNKPEPNEIIPVYLTNKGMINAVDLELTMEVSEGYSIEFLSDPTAEVIAPQQTLVFYARLISNPSTTNVRANAPKKSEYCFHIISKAKYHELCAKYTGDEFVSMLRRYGAKECVSSGTGDVNHVGGDGGSGSMSLSVDGSGVGSPTGWNRQTYREENYIIDWANPSKFCNKSGTNDNHGDGGNAQPGDDDNEESDMSPDENPQVPPEEPEEADCDEAPIFNFLVTEISGKYTRKGLAADGKSQVRIVLDGSGSRLPHNGCPEFVPKVWYLESDEGGTLEQNGYEAIYTAPETFSDSWGSSKEVQAVYTYSYKGKEYNCKVNFELIRVPVVFVHGLNSAPSSWNSMIKYLVKSKSYSDFQLSAVNYSATHNDRFITNTPRVYGHIRSRLSWLSKQAGYVCSGVDVVGHSMGGLLTKKVIQTYENPGIRRLITINTPHGGSQLGNFLLDPRVLYVRSIEDRDDWQIYDNAWARRALKGAYNLFAPSFGAFEDGAVANLSVNCDAINAINYGSTTGVKCHSIVTHSSGDFDDFFGLGDFAFDLIFEACGYDSTEKALDELFNHDRNDFIVPLESQRGGLEWPQSSPFGGLGKYDHTSTCTNEVIQQQVKNLLAKDINSEFFADGFSATPHINFEMPTLENVYDIYPLNSSTKKARTREIKASDINWESHYMEDENILSVTVYNEDLKKITIAAIGDNLLSCSRGNEAQFSIPENFAGEISVLCEGRDVDDNYFCVESKVYVDNRESIKPESIEFESDSAIIINDEYLTPVVSCLWDNGNISTLESPSLKIVDESIAYIDSLGNIYGKKHGNTTLIASFGELECNMQISVRKYSNIENNDEDKDDSKAICSTITLSFKQQSVMTRQAFRGTLTLNNGYKTDALKDFKLNLEVRDEDGILMGKNKFEIALDSLKGFEGKKDFNAGWTLAADASGVATVLFIPTKYAAPTEPKDYSFGGSFSYTDPSTGTTVTRDLNPVTLTVNPSPNLEFTYFMQRDVIGDDPLTEDVVEPSEEAEFSLLINNKGYGDAKNMRLTVKQPSIVENEKGLVATFELMSSQLNGGDKLLAFGGDAVNDFGDIKAQKTAYAQWWLKSSLLGHFIEYDVKATHVTSYDNPDLSLLDSISIHELIRSIEIGKGENRMVGFMVNDIPDENDLPDMLYLSNGERMEVAMASTSNIVKKSDSDYVLTIVPSYPGWNYGNIVDPTYGVATLRSVVRQSDGKEISLRNFWLTDRTLRDGKEPLYENRIHFVDNFETGSETYVLTFDPVPELVLEVALIENIPEEETIATSPVDNINVMFNKVIDPETFTYEDISLTVQGVKQNIESIKISTQDNKTFALDLSDINKECGNGYYVLTVQTTNITDIDGLNGKTGKSANWNMYRDGLMKINTSVVPINAGEISGDCKPQYGETLTLSASSNEGYEFSHWTVDGAEYGNEDTLNTVAISDMDVIGNFTRKSYSVEIDSDIDGGSISGPGTGIYSFGDEIQLTATPNTDYEFCYWTVDGEYADSDPSLTIVVSKETYVSAQFKYVGKYYLDQNLSKGWNWISIYMNEPQPVEMLFNNADRIMDQFNESFNDSEFGFVGGISNIEPGKAYKVKARNYYTVTFSGKLHDLEQNPIELKRGWNWIAYPYFEARNINTVLVNAQEGDYISSQYGFTSYEDGCWEGSLDQLRPGLGYLYKSANDKTLEFDFDMTSSNGVSMVRELTQSYTETGIDVHKYPNTMNITARLYQGGFELSDNEYEIYAMSGNELRGVGQLVNGNYYITVYGDKPVEISFIIKDSATNASYIANETLIFTSDTVGSRKSPFVLTIGEVSGIDSLTHDNQKISIYTIQGWLINSDATMDDIRKLNYGIYIINGRKYLVR